MVAGVLAWWALLEEVPFCCPLHLKGGPVVAGVLAWWVLLEEVSFCCPLHLKGGPIVAGVLAWWALLEEVSFCCPLHLKGGPIVAGVLAWWALLAEAPVRCPLPCVEISCFYDTLTHRPLLCRSVGLLCQHRPPFSISSLLVTASSYWAGQFPVQEVLWRPGRSITSPFVAFLPASFQRLTVFQALGDAGLLEA